MHTHSFIQTKCTKKYKETWKTQKLTQYTEWAKKVSCCFAGCNFVNYGPI